GVASLLEEGGFRVPGAEAVCQRLQALAREAAGRCEQLGREHAEAADRAYFALNGTFVPGSGSALNAAEAAAALRAFAGGRYQALLLRQVCDCYAALLSRLGDLLRDLHVVRRRLGELAGQLRSIDPGDDAGA